MYRFYLSVIKLLYLFIYLISYSEETMSKAYENRELSWLKFNERVIEEAEDNTVPPYERLKFISIFHNNLDEFFMVRVGSLGDKVLIKNAQPDKITNMTAKEQLSEIYKRTVRLMERKDRVYSKVRSVLASKGVCHEKIDNLSKVLLFLGLHFYIMYLIY